MTDRRRLWSNGRVAHRSLINVVEADQFTDGIWRQISCAKSALLNAPEGTRERELLFGEKFCVIDQGDTHSFGFAERDNHAGYVANGDLHETLREPTHIIDAARSYVKATPDFKAYEPVIDLSFGSMVEVVEERGAWSGIALRFPDEPGKTPINWMPGCHLRPVRPFLSDHIDVAIKFLGTPYLWGGNSSFGIDCSGLVQAACLACGTACPGDSDMQQAELGTYLADDAPLQRGDLLFWKGHVAWVVNPDMLIHANAFHMAVAYEPLQDAIQRIEAQGDGPVSARKRLGDLT